MMLKPSLITCVASLVVSVGGLASTATASDLPVARHMAVSGDATVAAPMILAALTYAAFWNTGDEAFAHRALAADFTDRTLPSGRPQGVVGPLQASKAFRLAVPDLNAEVEDLVVAGDRVSVRLHFRGHFTGQFGALQGAGQTVDFQAFDLYRVADGRIAENWHLEDNLSLMQQLGLVKP